MKKLFTIFLITLICCTIGIGKVEAVNIIGSEFTYSCTTTPNVYQVTAKIYRDCSAPELCANCPTSLSPTCGINLNIMGAGAGTPGVPANICDSVSYGTQNLNVVTSVSGFDILQLCNLTTNRTICSNCGSRTPGTFSPGIEVYTFQGSINLSSIPSSCCYVRLAWNACCQNAGATTLMNASTTNYYSELIINKCLTPCSSAPVFYNEPFTVSCAGQPTSYNLGAIDPDGDSLSYGMPAVKTGFNTPATYVSPYSQASPFLYLGWPNSSPPLVEPYGLSLNGATGDLRFTPLGLMEAPIVIEVKQWKKVNGAVVLAGVNSRQISVISKACPTNAPPNFRLYDKNGMLNSSPNPYNQTVCAGNEICFTITATDTNATSDTTTLSMMIHPKLAATGASVVKPKNSSGNNGKFDSLVFCWTPHDSMVSSLPYVLYVTAKDNVCPIPGRRTQTIRIMVSKEPLATINKVNLNCGRYHFSYTLLNNATLNMAATRFFIQNSPGSQSYTSYQSNVVNNHRFATEGWHKIRLELISGNPTYPSNTICGSTFIDSVFIAAPVKVHIRDTFLCGTGNILVKAQGSLGTPFGNAYRYAFFKGEFGNAIPIRALEADSSVIIPITQAGATNKYYVSIQDLNGCKDSMEFIIVSGLLPSKQMPSNVHFCKGFADTIDAGNNSGSIQKFLWRKINSNTLLLDSTSQKILVPNAGTYTVEKTTQYGCVKTDTIKVSIKTPTGIKAVVLGSDSICSGSLTTLSLSQSVGFKFMQWFKDSMPVFTANLQTIQIGVEGNYYAVLSDSNNCNEYTNSLKIKVNPKPIVGPIAGNIYPIVGNNVYVYSVPLNTQYQYKWLVDNNGIAVSKIDSHLVNIQWQTGQPKYLTVIATNPFACSDSSILWVQPQYPTPQILSFAPISGRTNDTISINGRELSSTQMVKFGNVAASHFQVISDSLVKGVVALGASGHVEILTLGGFANKPGFTYLSSGIEDISSNHEIRIYPNPTQDKINLSIPYPLLERCNRLRIYRTNGQEVLNQTITNEFVSIAIANLPEENMYWVEILDENLNKVFARIVIVE